MDDFIIEIFSDLVQKYDMKVNLKTKRTFSLFVMEDIPLEEKEVIKGKVSLIAKEMGRSKFIVENPYIVTIGGNQVVTSGIWWIRIL